MGSCWDCKRTDSRRHWDRKRRRDLSALHGQRHGLRLRRGAKEPHLRKVLPSLATHPLQIRRLRPRPLHLPRNDRTTRRRNRRQLPARTRRDLRLLHRRPLRRAATETTPLPCAAVSEAVREQQCPLQQVFHSCRRRQPSQPKDPPHATAETRPRSPRRLPRRRSP